MEVRSGALWGFCMCGICIWINKRGEVDAGRLARAAMLLRHRGPDAQRMVLLGGEGYSDVRWHDTLSPAPEGSARAGLAHTRLSILDLSTGSSQPFADGGRDFLVFNGEIYNYIEQREALKARHGAVFSTTGDTEVLYRSLQCEGAAGLDALNGMWAFAQLSLDRGEMLLGRDRYGKKPLFYYHDGEHFIAASECKCIFEILGIKRRVDRSFLDAFMALKWYPLGDNPDYLYKGIHLVPPGGTLRYRLADHSLDVVSRAPDELFGADRPDPERFAEEFASAVRLRLRADVPVGVLVSGGVDSTAICAQARGSSNLRYYTAVTLDEHGKAKADLLYSRQVAEDLGVELREIELPSRPESLLDDFRFLTRQLELPLNPFLVTYPGYLIYRGMAQDGIRVALDGTGGDEVMGGYPVYLNLVRYNLERQGRLLEALRLGREHQLHGRLSPLERLVDTLKTLKRFALRGEVDLPCRQLAGALAHRVPGGLDLRPMLRRHFLGDEACLEAMQRKALFNGAIPYYLQVNDGVSMASSVENRSPFLDHRLFKYLRLKDEWKFRDGMNKYLLRRSIPDAVRPGVRWRANKQGFGYSPGYFMGRYGAQVEEVVMGSDLLRRLYDVEGLRAQWKGAQPGLSGHLMRALFFIGLLDEAFPLDPA